MLHGYRIMEHCGSLSSFNPYYFVEMIQTLKINLKRVHYEVHIPEYARAGDAGVDLRAWCPGTKVLRIMPHETILVGTGLSLEIPAGYEGQVRSRSGMASKGLVVANSPGTIDSGYRGLIGVLLLNTTSDVRFIEHQDRIAQLIIAPVTSVEYWPVENLSETERGDGGFGSTGEK